MADKETTLFSMRARRLYAEFLIQANHLSRAIDDVSVYAALTRDEFPIPDADGTPGANEIALVDANAGNIVRCAIQLRQDLKEAFRLAHADHQNLVLAERGERD